MTVSNEVLIKATYEAKCEQIMMGWLNSNTRPYVSDSYAYAASVRMYPSLHLDGRVADGYQDPFDTAYKIPKELVDGVMKHVDTLWLKDSSHPDLAFNKLEDKFGGYKKYRMELVAILRYCSLHGIFDDAFYKAVSKNAPIEAHGITRPLDAHELLIA